MHARFRSGVIRLAERAFLPVNRRNIDDSAPSTLDHRIADLLGHVEDAVEIAIDDIAWVSVKGVTRLAHRLQPFLRLGVAWRMSRDDRVFKCGQLDADGLT